MNECTRKINKSGDQNNWIENLEIYHETYNQVFGLSYLDLVESLKNSRPFSRPKFLYLQIFGGRIEVISKRKNLVIYRRVVKVHRFSDYNAPVAQWTERLTSNQ